MYQIHKAITISTSLGTALAAGAAGARRIIFTLLQLLIYVINLLLTNIACIYTQSVVHLNIIQLLINEIKRLLTNVTCI